MTSARSPIPSRRFLKNALCSLALIGTLLPPLPSPVLPAPLPTGKLPAVVRSEKEGSGVTTQTVTPQEQRAITRRALDEATAEREQQQPPPPGISRQEMEERRSLLDGIVSRLGSQLNLLDERETLRKRLATAQQLARNWPGFSEKPPYPVLLVDDLREQELIARAKVQGLQSTHRLIAQQVALHRDAARRAREQERQEAERISPDASLEVRLPALWRSELAAIRARNRETIAAWSALNYEVMGERLNIARAELELLERKLAESRKAQRFSQADLHAALARLKSERAGLEGELESGLARDTGINGEMVRLQRQLQESPSVAGKGRAALEARYRATLARAEDSRFAIEVTSALITINQSFSTLWEKRFAAATAGPPSRQREFLADVRRSREMLVPWLEYARHQVEVYQAAEREQRARVSPLPENSPLRTAEKELLLARRSQWEQAERLQGALQQADIRLKGWQEDVELAQKTRSALDRARDGGRRVWEVLRRVWHFELFTVEDTVSVAGQRVVTSRGVTVGKSVGAVLLFLAGYLMIAFLGRRIQRLATTRFGMSAHLVNILHRGFLVVAIFSLLFVILNLARIPLTVFAFLGGALAIGAGFGTQTLIKNLISGIFLLLERKVQVGDTVDVDGVVGTVTSVGIRASTVLGFDGVETVIPNATFLESKVTNWTHTNARLRRLVRVGVAFGSPVARVRDILAECADRHGTVLKSPQPLVLLEDFGDSSLLFGLYFWIEFGPDANPLRVASDLRFMIERRFAEEGIIMAFPQRDVHLSGARPLRVQLVEPTQPGENP